MNISRKTIPILVASLLVAVFSFGGCSDDDPTEPIAEVTPPIEAETPDDLMLHFVSLYTELKLQDLEDILHADFQLHLSHNTIVDWGLAEGAILDRNQMLEIHSNLLGGISGTDGYGNSVLPIDRIDFSIFERIGNWVEILADDPLFSGTHRGVYNMRAYFHDTSGVHAFLASQQVIFYAVQTGEYWYLKGIVSLSEKAIEWTDYDRVLYMYKTVPAQAGD